MKDLKAYRNKHNLSQKQLAEYIGVVQASISIWESGKVEPSGPAKILLTMLIELGAKPEETVFSNTRDFVMYPYPIQRAEPQAMEAQGLKPKRDYHWESDTPKK